MRLILLAYILVFLASCNNETTTETPHPLDNIQQNEDENIEEQVSLYELSWIQGMWIDSTSFPGNKVIENWQLINDTLIGNRGTIKGVDTNYSQLSKIFINNGKPVYLLEPEGSSFVSFKTKAYKKGSITFGNIANPVPTEISYIQNGLNLDLYLTSLTPAGERKFKHHFIPTGK